MEENITIICRQKKIDATTAIRICGAAMRAILSAIKLHQAVSDKDTLQAALWGASLIANCWLVYDLQK